jgi:hypothetical protein
LFWETSSSFAAEFDVLLKYMDLARPLDRLKVYKIQKPLQTWVPITSSGFLAFRVYVYEKNEYLDPNVSIPFFPKFANLESYLKFANKVANSVSTCVRQSYP